MHDATECGVWGGLFEVAQASNVGMEIHKDEIIVQERVRKICELFRIDPYSSISEGTLIITVRPHKSGEVLQRLSGKGIIASEVGEVVPEEGGIIVTDGTGRTTLTHPRVDPFWEAFGKALSEGAK
jgi:hydrogenase maturation factor